MFKTLPKTTASSNNNNEFNMQEFINQAKVMLNLKDAITAFGDLLKAYLVAFAKESKDLLDVYRGMRDALSVDLSVPERFYNELLRMFPSKDAEIIASLEDKETFKGYTLDDKTKFIKTLDFVSGQREAFSAFLRDRQLTAIEWLDRIIAGRSSESVELSNSLFARSGMEYMRRFTVNMSVFVPRLMALAFDEDGSNREEIIGNYPNTTTSQPQQQSSGTQGQPGTAYVGTGRTGRLNTGGPRNTTVTTTVTAQQGTGLFGKLPQGRAGILGDDEYKDLTGALLSAKDKVSIRLKTSFTDENDETLYKEIMDSIDADIDAFEANDAFLAIQEMLEYQGFNPLIFWQNFVRRLVASKKISSRQELMSDMRLILMMLIVRGSKFFTQRIQSKTLMETQPVLSTMKIKYNIIDEVRTAQQYSPEDVTLPRLAACLPVLVFKLLEYEGAGGQRLGRTVGEPQENLPRGLMSPGNASLIPKEYKKLFVTFIRWSASFHDVVNRVRNNKFYKTPISNVLMYAQISMDSPMVKNADRLKLFDKQSKGWKIWAASKLDDEEEFFLEFLRKAGQKTLLSDFTKFLEDKVKAGAKPESVVGNEPRSMPGGELNNEEKDQDQK